MDRRALHVRVRLAWDLMEQGFVEEAETQLSTVIADDPDFAEAHMQLGNCATRRGDQALALERYETTLVYDPDHSHALNNVAWLLATDKDPEVRRQSRVVALAERAVELSFRAEPSPLATLGVAYAAASRFDEAIATTKEALDLLPEESSDPQLRRKLQERLILFETQLPYQQGR